MQEPETVIIKADEVDEPPPPPEAFTAAAQEHPIPSLQPTTQSTAERPNAVQQRVPASISARPVLSRDTSAPQPQETWIDLPNSNPPGDFMENNVQHNPGLWDPAGRNASDQIDSLSLGQLRKIVYEMPKLEPAPYAFEYRDASAFAEELDEFFDYSWEERSSLIRVQTTFGRLWSDFISTSASAASRDQPDWCKSEETLKRVFLDQLKSKIDHGDDGDKMESLESVAYLALGCWYETAGLRDGPYPSSPDELVEKDSEHRSSFAQICCIKENIRLISQILPPAVFYTILRHAYDPQSTSRDEGDCDNYGIDPQPDIYQQRERWLSTVLLYLMVDLATRNPDSVVSQELRNAMAPIQSKFLVFLTDIFARSRWEDNDGFPSSKLLLLYWKLILLNFGGLADVAKIKSVLAGKDSGDTDTESEGPLITASPLDYHVFRQEIMSKYPAYSPPPPLFPFDHDHNSFLPSLQDTNGKDGSASMASSSAGPANIPGAGSSIMNQPVHIATPAPSPPPSPAGPGGKGLKKQNYQTNQMFPFLYPPLDESSNDLGGKGSTELQDLFAGRKWQGSDIPASILEAAHLFSKRMRATRAMKQLWGERVRFMKHEQSYGAHERPRSTPDEKKTQDDGPNDDDMQALNDEAKRKLRSVEDFYKTSLPRLQSFVIVLLKTLLQNITTLITQSGSLEAFPGNGNSTEPDTNTKPAANAEADHTNAIEDDNEDHLNDLLTTRNQEIMSKAVSGILILLLKWFKLSHILKFEYLAQLLLDSNYIQLVLKLFTHQELERAVTYKCEVKDLNFLNFCRANSRNAKDLENNGSDNEDDLDEAVPPPISLTREQANKSAIRSEETSTDPDNQVASSAPTPAPTQPPPRPPAPEVDELGYPMSTLPAEPITYYSWRTFFTAINYLKVLQKVVKSKPHRQLLMVQGKYSNTLKKHLKVPQSDVRLYTLKIIKGQVPYCHRKWRQGNMRIITAIYLHVKPGLRDEWLSGLDVEQEVGEALPAEQALRALTYWYNIRNFPDEMGVSDSSSDLVSEIGSVLALSDLDITADYTDDTEAEKLKSDFTEVNELQNVDGQASTLATLESASSKPFQERDFFLRELENMDLGLSLYGVTSSALSPSAMTPASPQQPPIPGPSPPSTRILPMPDIVAEQLESDDMVEPPPNPAETKNSAPNAETSSSSNEDHDGSEQDQDNSQETFLTASERPVLEVEPTASVSISSNTRDVRNGVESEITSSDYVETDESDVIVIAKDTITSEIGSEPAHPVEGVPTTDPSSAIQVSVKAIAEDGLGDNDDNADDENEDDDDEDMIADEDVEEGENMVLAQ